MKISAVTLILCVHASLGLLSTNPVHAFDLSGAWATDANVCNKIFTKGETIVFKRNSAVFGGGFVADGKTIRGPAAKCAIRAKKDDGANTHVIATCSMDVMVGSVQFSFKIINDNHIVRVYPGMEGMEISYYRCLLPK